jgi:hypothetical protein
MDAFLMQAKRVLRHNGYFLYADLRGKDKVDTLYKQLCRSGMALIKETNITPNVLEALNLDYERRMALIQESIHTLFVNSFREFAGVKGSTIYEGLLAGRVIYQSFVLQKDEN